jgi:taurine dioxygenase
MNAFAPITASGAPDDAGLTVTPVGPVLGAEISGVDLRQPLAPEVVAAIRAALLRHKVVFFRDQDISHEDHVRFGRYFGDLEGHPVTAHVPGFPEILHIEAADGMKLREEIVPIVRVANKWHTDVTFRPAPSMGGVLRMRHMPPLGGDTLFADTAAIYRDLPDRLKDQLATLSAEHDILQSYGYRVDEAKRQELRAAHPVQAHPVVRQAAGRSAGPGEDARIPGPLPLDAERHRLLGQPRHPALRHSRLLAAGAHRRAGHDPG